MTTLTDSVSAILLDWAAGSFSLTLLLFSLSEMMMRTSLLHMKQQAAWSCHLQLLQHSLKCSDVWRHFKKSVISHVWQLIQSAEINTLWLWIRIALMYNDWWVLIWFNRIQSCIDRTFTLNSIRMSLVWEKWVYWVSCVTFWFELPQILELKICACWYKSLSVRYRVNQ